jgi:hypothetical protein
MLTSRRSSSGVIGRAAGAKRFRRAPLLAAVAVAAVLAPVGASQASAAEPETVTVRVEGFNGVTLLGQTQVTTSTTAIPVEGASCSGTSAGGALYDAIHGNWQVKNEPEGISILGIDGVDLPPFGVGNYAYWSLWVNSEFASSGACTQEVGPNAHIVFAGQCFALGAECPTSASAPDHFLTSTPPTSSAVGVGEPVSVTIGALSTISAGQESLPGGVSVTGGSLSAAPNAQGVATLSFGAAGTYTLQAHAPDSVPSDSYAVCVHNGNDGTCGTSAPSGSGGATASGVSGFKTAAIPYRGPYALVADVSDVINGHFYRRGGAPRLLSGTVLAHSSVSSVSLELRRQYRGRCYAYDGVRARFLAARCGHGSFFAVSGTGKFSYLLPSSLAPGRYVLDVQAHDVAGNTTTLARGTSRVVFHVR